VVGFLVVVVGFLVVVVGFLVVVVGFLIVVVAGFGFPTISVSEVVIGGKFVGLPAITIRIVGVITACLFSLAGVGSSL